MRETFRSLDNFDYWEKRWESIETDDAMVNKDKYPLKYTLETIKLNNGNQKILEAGCGAGRILKYLNDFCYVHPVVPLRYTDTRSFPKHL